MKNGKVANNVLAYTSVGLIIAEILLIIGSWAVSSVMPTMQIRSVLSGEGLRWLLGKTVANLTSPFLVWLTLLTTAMGFAMRCGIYEDIKLLRHKEQTSFRLRLGLILVMLETLSIAIVIILLSAVPHAILLNVEGNLFPSSFSDSIVPVFSFTITLCATTYGITVARFSTTQQWFAAACCGFGKAAPVFIFYILISEVLHTIRFVLGL